MDKSELELAGCLRRLLRTRYILRSRNESWFKALIDSRKRLQEITQTFGAYLEINEPLGVAYLRGQNEEIEEQLAIRLTRSHVLSPFATVLILHLRWHRLQFYLQPTGDDVPVIGALEMREFLHQFDKSQVDAQFERQFRRCLEDLQELQILIETSNSSGFYEITSLCDLLLPADQIRELKGRADAYFSRVNNVVEGGSDAG